MIQIRFKGLDPVIDGWMNCNLTPFSTVFQSYQDIWMGDNERLCAVEPGLQLNDPHLKWGLNLGQLD